MTSPTTGFLDLVVIPADKVATIRQPSSRVVRRT